MQAFRRGAIAAIAVAATSVALADGDIGVVVTATRTPTRASAVLSDISVISHNDVRRAAQSTLGELLQSQPDVQSWSNGGPGSVSSVSIRGSSTQQTLILVDGQRLSSATEGTTALENIPLNQIERIEVLRGPASALYGADALGGVIQIFTRSGSGKPRLSGEFGVGSYHTTSGSVNYGGAIGANRFNINAGYSDSGGFSATKPGAYGFNPDRDPYANRNLSAQFARRIGNDHEVGARVFYSDGTTHYDASNCDPTYTVCTTNFDNYQNQTLSSFSAYATDRLSPAWTSHLRVGRSEDRLTSYSLDPVAHSVSGQTYRTTQDQLSWQNDLALPDGKLMLAAEARRERVDSNAVNFLTSQRITRSLVVGYQAWFGAHSLQIGARSDTISNFGSHTSASLAYGYQIAPALRTSVSVGTAFRAPTFDDLYWPVDYGSYYVGNPNLSPERALNKELDLVYESAGRRIALSVFHNRVRDLISFADATTPAFFITTVNVGAAVLKGATATYSDVFGDWNVRASYDLLSARDASTDLFLARRAQRHATAALRYAAGRWSAGAEVVAYGARYDDAANTRRMGGFALLNLDARFALNKAWSLFARLNNAFDKHYERVSGFNTSGANLFVGLRYAPK